MTYRVCVRGDVILNACLYSPSFWFRAKGLLGRKILQSHEGILLKPCNGIHMFFMKFPIDAIFLDQKNKIVKIFENIKPWQMTPILWKAHAVLEAPSGFAKKFHLQENDELIFEATDKGKS